MRDSGRVHEGTQPQADGSWAVQGRPDLSASWRYLLPAQIEGREKSTGEIAEALGLDHSTVVRQIAAVERLGFAERRPHLRDPRSMLVGMTAFRGAAIAKMRAKRRARLTVILADWSDDEMERLGAMLGRLNAALAANDKAERRWADDDGS